MIRRRWTIAGMILAVEGYSLIGILNEFDAAPAAV